MLEATEDIHVVATASNGLEAVAKAAMQCPDVAVIDGIEATRQIRERCQFTRVLILSIFDYQEYVQRAMEVGAVGFVLKDTVGRDLLAAVPYMWAIATSARGLLRSPRDI